MQLRSFPSDIGGPGIGLTNSQNIWDFFSCVGTLAPPAAKMPWGYLSVKMWMYKGKNSSLKYIQNIGTSVFKYD